MLRQLLDSDKPIIRDWIARCPYHAPDGVSEEFLYRDDGFSVVAEDELGPVIFIKIEPVDADIARVHMQFDIRQRRRNAIILVRDWPLVKLAVLGAKLRYLIFHSVSDQLVRFCKKRFGFSRVGDTNDYFIDLFKGES